MNLCYVPAGLGKLDKIVVHLGSEVVKGYLQGRDGPEALEELQAEFSEPCHGSVSILREDGALQSAPTAALKAVRFVKQFDESRTELLFYKSRVTMGTLWVRVRFKDGEMMEGLMPNSLTFLMGPGLFLKPVDPRSNNLLVYVAKRWIQEFQVLGLRDS